MNLSDWSGLQSDGTIDDTPANCFQYRYDQFFEVPWNAIGFIIPSVIGSILPVPELVTWSFEGEWVAYIESGPTRIFEQRVKTTYNAVAIVHTIMAMPVISLFTWWVSNESIETTICNHILARAGLAEAVTATDVEFPLVPEAEGGPAVSFPAPWYGYAGRWEYFPYGGFRAASGDDPAWLLNLRRSYGTAHDADTVVREAPATFPQAIEQGYNIPGGGADYSVSGGVFYNTWYSPIYGLVLPGDAVFGFDFHNVGSAKLSYSYSTISTRVCAGPAALLRFPDQGMVLVGASSTTGATVRGAVDLDTINIQASRSFQNPYAPASTPPPELNISGAHDNMGNAIVLRVRTTSRIHFLWRASNQLYWIDSVREGAELREDWDRVILLGPKDTYEEAVLTYRFIEPEPFFEPGYSYEFTHGYLRAAGLSDDGAELLLVVSESVKKLGTDPVEQGDYTVAYRCRMQAHTDHPGRLVPVAGAPILMAVESTTAGEYDPFPALSSMWTMLVEGASIKLLGQASGGIMYYESNDGMETWGA